MTENADFSARREKARTLLREGQYQPAAVAFEEALLLNPDDADMHEELAMAHFMLGAFESAVRHLQQTTRLDPKRATALINLGAVYNRMGDYTKAVDALRRGIQFDRRSSEAYYNLGFAYRRSKQWALAIPAYREAIRLDPQLAEAYQNLGTVYLEMNNVQQALANFRKALELRPNFEKARVGLEKCQTLIADAKRAKNPFGRLVSEAASDPAAAPASARTLTAEEREHDRQRLMQLAGELGAAAQQLLDLLKDDLEPALVELNKTTTQPSPRAAMVENHQIFHNACKQYAPLATRVRELITEIRAHETSMQ